MRVLIFGSVPWGIVQVDNHWYRVNRTIPPELAPQHGYETVMGDELRPRAYWVTLDAISDEEAAGYEQAKEADWQERVTHANKWWRRLLS